MKVITAYETADGQVFTNKAAAVEHDSELSLSERIREFAKTDQSLLHQGHKASLISWLTIHRTAILKALA